ncbi:MAG TPA: chorismate synthase [Ktedonobacterales bacterium]|nr:chorismate synthase [Ktedonobacterales bacterium]
MFRFLTAGESHGPGLTAIIEGIPAGLGLSVEDINPHLYRRQQGYGRGGRMKIESDQVILRSGVRHGLTLGSPITLEINNRDWENWQVKMSSTPVEEPVEEVVLSRPGHADFAGAMKYGHRDIRNVIERSSARETAARVAVGAVCLTFLRAFGVEIHSHVLSIGPVGYRDAEQSAVKQSFSADYWERVEHSPVRCGDSDLEAQMIEQIHQSKPQGETCGGIFEVVATGVPIGLGSYSQWDRRLSARLAMALMSIPSIKGVEIGEGFESTALPGSQVHDVLQWQGSAGWQHLSNNAGGIEGGISNGAPIVARAAVKPISTLAHPLPSVNIQTRENLPEGRYERSDVCVVPAAGVVGETMVAIALTEAWLEKFGGDSMDEIAAHVRAFRTQVETLSAETAAS